MREIHPSELINQINDLRYAKSTTWALLILSITLCASAATVKGKINKIGLSGSALLIAGLSSNSKSQLKSKKELLGDVSEASKVGFRSVLASYFLPASKLSIQFDINTWKPEIFDWELFNSKPEKYPHLGIVAESGGGKSTTAEWFCTWLNGVHIAFAPHFEPGDFPGLPLFGLARNYGDDDDEPANFQEMINSAPGRYPSISYASGFKAIFVEMNRRYQERDKGNTDFPIVNIHLDEFNAFIDSVSFSDDAEIGLAFMFRRLLMESRKVGLRLIPYLQSDDVKSLKLEGRGQVRKNLKFIRLGTDGLKHIKKLSAKDYPLLEWLKKEMKTVNTFPAMVEDSFAWIPNFKRNQSAPQLPQDLVTISPVTTPEVTIKKIKFEELNEAQQQLVRFAQERPNQPLKADTVKQYERYFKDKSYSPDELRILFQSTADVGWGIVMGEGNRLAYGWYDNLQ